MGHWTYAWNGYTWEWHWVWDNYTTYVAPPIYPFFLSDNDVEKIANKVIEKMEEFKKK